MLYRHQEVLQALADNPKGLTTAGIFSVAKEKVGSELPNTTAVSQIIFSMRGAKPKLVTTSDAAGGNIHKITDAGREALKAALAEQGETLNQAADQFIADMTETTLSNQQIEQLTDCDNPDNAEQAEGWNLFLSANDPLESAFANLILQLRNINPAPEVENKAELLTELQRLENNDLLIGKTRAAMTSIRLIVEQLDEAA